MTPSVNFYDLLTQFEGLKLNAYQDSAGIPTVGIGTIRYPDGRPVRMGDVCTKVQANEWARYEAGKMATKLNNLITGVNQNEFDALLLLMYNIGAGGLEDSTVLKRIKGNAPAEQIRAAWLMWNKARVKGKLVPIEGLTNRRNKELELFLKPI